MNRRKFLKTTGSTFLAGAMLKTATLFASENELFSELQNTGDNFEFALLADTHIGSRKNSRYYSYQQSIKEINRNHECKFMSVVGDIVGSHKEAQFNNFIELTKQFEGTPIPVHGNHDGRFPWKGYLRTQAELGAPADRTYYSFDCGKWHFVSFPSLIPQESPEEKEIFSWFDMDLLKNKDRPTMVFIHHHMLPIGLTQLEFYNHPYRQRKDILETIIKYGNVKYVFMGHVHNGIQTSVKTAWHYKGANFILVPTTVPPRPFGEEYPPFEDGFEKGGYYLTLKVKGRDVSIFGHLNHVNTIRKYPDKFDEFKPEIEPKWLTKIIKRDTYSTIKNGSFEEGMKYWFTPYRYKTDNDPAFIAKTVQNPVNKNNALYLQSELKGRRWAFDELNCAYQIVKPQPEKHPVLKLKYSPQKISEFSGAYICAISYKDEQPICLMLFYYGDDRKVKYTPRSLYYNATYENSSAASLSKMGKDHKALFYKLPSDTGKTHTLTFDIKDLYEKSLQASSIYKSYTANRILIELGVFAGKTNDSHSSAFYDEVFLEYKDKPVISKINKRPIRPSKNLFKTEFGINK